MKYSDTSVDFAIAMVTEFLEENKDSYHEGDDRRICLEYLLQWLEEKK